MAREDLDDVEYEKTLRVHGYHVYKQIWNATMGEKLMCVIDPSNSLDNYAIAVEKDRTIIGHLPRIVSRVSIVYSRVYFVSEEGRQN